MIKNIENKAGFSFLRHLEEGFTMQFDYMFSEDIDIEILEKAWRITLDECPYYERSMECEEGKLVFVPHTCSCHVEEIEDPEKETPSDGPSFGKDLMWVRAKGNRLRTGISHAMTDGFGINLFTRLLLFHYFSLKDGKEYQKPFADPATGALLQDPDSDVYADALFPTGGAPDGLVPEERAFVLPEGDSSFGVHQICVDDRRFTEVCAKALGMTDPAEYQALSKKVAPIGGLDPVAMYILLGKVLQKVYADNELRYACRFPINCRSICGRSFMLRNASHAQAWLTHPAAFFRNDAGTADVQTLVRTIDAWLQPEVIGWELDCLMRWRQGREVDMDFQKVFRNCTILITSMGNSIYEPEPGRITGYKDHADFGMPCLHLFRINSMRFLALSHLNQPERIMKNLEGFFN